jgi:hypothetical protein
MSCSSTSSAMTMTSESNWPVPGRHIRRALNLHQSELDPSKLLTMLSAGRRESRSVGSSILMKDYRIAMKTVP